MRILGITFAAPVTQPTQIICLVQILPRSRLIFPLTGKVTCPSPLKIRMGTSLGRQLCSPLYYQRLMGASLGSRHLATTHTSSKRGQKDLLSWDSSEFGIGSKRRCVQRRLVATGCKAQPSFTWVIKETKSRTRRGSRRVEWRPQSRSSHGDFPAESLWSSGASMLVRSHICALTVQHDTR
jgi:hypothetical protein